LTWEFRLNIYAFFASGHLDNNRGYNEYSSTNVKIGIIPDGIPNKFFNMNWKVTNISIRLDLWDFDKSVNSIVEN